MKRAVEKLVALADAAHVFTSDGDEAFASVEVGAHREAWAIESSEFGAWLLALLYRTSHETGRQADVREAQRILAARARYDGPRESVFLRVAELQGRHYLDLADDEWRVVEIDGDGWRILDNSPVCFRRTPTMHPLPIPERGGSLDELRAFINLPSDDEWQLFLGFVLNAYRPAGPFPILLVMGEQGNAKSTLARLATSLIDPKKAVLRGEPRNERDLIIAASHSWCLCYDNLSRIPPWLSDSLCRLATGGGFAARKLFTDTDEVVLDVQRPVILTGIADVASRSDLLDRSLVLELPPISNSDRRPEQEFWQQFQAAHPRILGALLNTLSAALRELPSVRLDDCPRMADFARFGAATEKACGSVSGTFSAAYSRNRAKVNDTALDASPITTALISFVNRERVWQGTAGELLEVLSVEAGDALTRDSNWPRNARAFAEALRRGAPNLRAAGVTVTFSRSNDSTRRRMIKLVLASGPSGPSGSAVSQDEGFKPQTTETAKSVLPAAVAEVFAEGLCETRAVLQRAKNDGDLRTWAAAARELRAVAVQMAGGKLNLPSANHEEEIRRFTDDELDEFIRRHAEQLGYKKASGGGDAGAVAPEGGE